MIEQLEHKADLKFKVTAKDINELFTDITNAVYLGIFEKHISFYSGTKEIVAEGKTTELLIHNYIEELLYVANHEAKKFHLLGLKFENNLNTKKVIAQIGIKDATRKDYNVEVKACSYSIQLTKNEKGKTECVFVLDI